MRINIIYKEDRGGFDKPYEPITIEITGLHPNILSERFLNDIEKFILNEEELAEEPYKQLHYNECYKMELAKEDIAETPGECIDFTYKWNRIQEYRMYHNIAKVLNSQTFTLEFNLKDNDIKFLKMMSDKDYINIDGVKYKKPRQFSLEPGLQTLTLERIR